MARTPDKNSPRQKAFAYLDGELTSGKSREAVVADLCKKLNITESYGATLFQSHRKISKEAGKLKEVFVVRDHKDGKAVTPYMSSHYVAKVADTDATTPAKAKKAYETGLRSKIAEAKKL